jgi:hypothetical protein
MDTASSSNAGILIEDDDHGTTLQDGNCTSSHNGDIHDLVVIKPLDINTAKRSQDDTHVKTSKSTIGPMVHQ